MYSSWLLISSCLTNLLNSLNISQSSGVPDCLALSYLLELLFPYHSLDVPVYPRCVPSSVKVSCAVCVFQLTFE